MFGWEQKQGWRLNRSSTPGPGLLGKEAWVRFPWAFWLQVGYQMEGQVINSHSLEGARTWGISSPFASLRGKKSRQKTLEEESG